MKRNNFAAWLADPSNEIDRRELCSFCQEALEVEGAALQALCETLTLKEYSRRQKRISTINAILSKIRTLS